MNNGLEYLKSKNKGQTKAAKSGKLFKKAQIIFLVFSFMYVLGQLLRILYIELWQS